MGPVPFGTGAGTTSAAIGLAPVLLVAFLTGMAHAAEPDHLAAVSTLVAMGRGWGRALLQGLLWGAGHTLVILIAGVAGAFVPWPRTEGFDLLVGVALVALGLRLVLTLRRSHVHFHRHGSGVAHAHFHHNTPDHTHDHRHDHRAPVGWGVLHGLAGSGGVVLAATAAMPSPWEAVLFIAAFGFGTVVAMTMAAAVLGLVVEAAAAWFARAETVLRAASGVASASVGVWLVASLLRG